MLHMFLGICEQVFPDVKIEKIYWRCLLFPYFGGICTLFAGLEGGQGVQTLAEISLDLDFELLCGFWNEMDSIC